MGESGYGFIVDKDGKVIAHKDKATVTNETNYIEMGKSDKSFAATSANIQDMITGKYFNQIFTFKRQDSDYGIHGLLPTLTAGLLEL